MLYFRNLEDGIEASFFGREGAGKSVNKLSCFYLFYLKKKKKKKERILKTAEKRKKLDKLHSN